MSISAGADEERDEHHHGHARGHGTAISGDNILIAGGFFAIYQNQVYSSLPADIQQQALDILCSRIDGRFLHNSSEYEYILMRRSQHTPDTAHEYLQHIFQEVIDHLPGRGAIRHGSSYHIRMGSSKHISIPVAERLTCQGSLLATVILPDSKPPCTKFIVTTLAYQLVQKIPSTAAYMLTSLRQDQGIFERNTETQFRELFKTPLEKAYMNTSVAEKDNWPNIVLLDGNAQDFAPGSVADWILQSFGVLPVNTITLIEVRSQNGDLAPRPRSLAQRVLIYLYHLLRFMIGYN